MNEIKRYLAEEIAIDCANGHITRHEALRRFKVMGLSAAVSAALLAACGSDDNAAVTTPTTNVEMDDAMPAANPTTPPAMPGAAPTSSSGNEGNDDDVPLAPTDPASAEPGMQASSPMAEPVPGAGPDTALPTEAITFDGPNGRYRAPGRALRNRAAPCSSSTKTVA